MSCPNVRYEVRHSMVQSTQVRATCESPGIKRRLGEAGSIRNKIWRQTHNDTAKDSRHRWRQRWRATPRSTKTGVHLLRAHERPLLQRPACAGIAWRMPLFTPMSISDVPFRRVPRRYSCHSMPAQRPSPARLCAQCRGSHVHSEPCSAGCKIRPFIAYRPSAPHGRWRGCVWAVGQVGGGSRC